MARFGSLVFVLQAAVLWQVSASEPTDKSALKESSADLTKQASKLPEGYVDEAPLPAGFPPPGPVGVVVDKEYPLSRSFSSTGRQAFWQCFAYLQKNDYKMTAPVVMDVDDQEDNPQAPSVQNMVPVAYERMHFLLEDPTMDEPRKEGAVRVADMPKMRVLSIAHQGNLTAAQVQAAHKALRRELKKHPEIKAAGPLRLLGYNGPAVPREKRYWEIQLPIRAAAKEKP